MMKQTPKSCSCRACRRGKGSRHGQFIMKSHERAMRHKNKIALDKFGEDADIKFAPIGNYYD